MSTQQVQLLERLVEGGFVGALYIASEIGVPEGESATFDASESSSGGAFVTAVALNRPTKVFWEHDPDGDGTYPISIKIEQFDAIGLSMLNNVPISEPSNLRLRLENDGAGKAEYIVAGSESAG